MKSLEHSTFNIQHSTFKSTGCGGGGFRWTLRVECWVLNVFHSVRLVCALTLLVFCFVKQVHAVVPVETTAMFDSANRLYDEGKYTAAASSYEKLVEAGVMSPALYFNLGNSFFKSGQIGRAIAAYRKAEQMSPRDPDVQGNLQFARNQVQGPTMRPTRAQKALGRLTVNEWTVVTMAGLWVSLLLLATMQWRPGWRVSLRGLTAAIIGATVVLAICLILAWNGSRTSDIVIVIRPDTMVRNGPLESSQNSFTAQDGAEMRVIDKKTDWLQVTDSNGRVGWVNRDAVVSPGRS